MGISVKGSDGNDQFGPNLPAMPQRPFDLHKTPYDPRKGRHMPLGLRELGVFTVIKEQGDHLLCRAWNGKETLVAKPWALRRSSLDGETFDEITYEYDDVNERTASKEGESDEKQYITPDYFLGEKIVAYPHNVGAGAQGAELKWEDINTAGRHWAVPSGWIDSAYTPYVRWIRRDTYRKIYGLDISGPAQAGDRLDVTASIPLSYQPDYYFGETRIFFQIRISTGATEVIGEMAVTMNDHDFWEWYTTDEVTILGFSSEIPENVVVDDSITIEVRAYHTGDPPYWWDVYEIARTGKSRMTARLTKGDAKLRFGRTPLGAFGRSNLGAFSRRIMADG